MEKDVETWWREESIQVLEECWKQTNWMCLESIEVICEFGWRDGQESLAVEVPKRLS